MSSLVRFPSPGCVVEYLEDNAVQIAMVLEESNGKLRLLTPTRREVKMAASRILPWPGPAYGASMGREEAARLLESHKRAREHAVSTINPAEVWEVSQGEIAQAPAQWFAELFESDPDVDMIAAYGRALLNFKTHFRFQPPDFIVYDSEAVDKKLEDKKNREEKEAIVAGGAAFLHTLWNLANQKKVLDKNEAAESDLLKDGKIEDRISKILFSRLINPESQEDEALWRMLGKGLPDVPFLPLQLLMAWGKLPPHYNFWLDRADFSPGDQWWLEYGEEVNALADLPSILSQNAMEDCSLPFISIDSAKTHDIDDAFYVEQNADDGWNLTVALACPALAWPFGGSFDKKILHRATSVYLPEGDYHMLPQKLGTDAYSLKAGEEKPALCLYMDLNNDGEIREFRPYLAKVKLAANLSYVDVQAVLDGVVTDANPAARFATMLLKACQMGRVRENWRIAQGAIVMRRPNPLVLLQGDGDDIKVDIVMEEEAEGAQTMIAEMMVLASAAVADWAQANNIPLVHRTQNITVPFEYAGIWEKPEDLTRIMRSLVPSVLEVEAAPHAALAVPRYAPITSPLRRYADMLNEAQVLGFLKNGKPRWTKEQLTELLYILSPCLDSVGQIQRFRPRYWKLLYFRQMGDRIWWPGIITDENENFVFVTLPDKGIFIRGRRALFDERACPGMKVQVRIGKVNPLYNEIHIMEVMSDE